MSLPKLKITVLALSVVALVSEASGQQPQAQTPAPAASVSEKGFRGRVFEVKYRDPESLRRVLFPLGSGFNGSLIDFSRELKIVSVRDFPENIAAMEEALKRLDTPEAAHSRPDIELRMHVLIGTSTEGASNQHPSELNDVVKQLKSSLNYRGYHLLTSLVQRTRDGASQVSGRGTAEVGPPVMASASTVNVEYTYNLNLVSLSPALTGASTVQLSGLRFSIGSNALGGADLQTSTGVRDGEKVVIGTASLKDKGLVVVLSARVIK